jgi:hypothetical protein
VLYLLVLAALVVVALALGVPLVRRNTRLDEVDRFHVARSLTTSWSNGPQPELKVPAEGDEG